MSSRFGWAGGGWAVLMLLVSMVDAASANLNCFRELNDGEVSFNGKCTKANVTLVVPTEKLNFELTYKDWTGPNIPLTINITNCLINGFLVAVNPNALSMAIGNVIFRFPIKGTLAGNEIKLVDKNDTHVSLPCFNAFKETNSGSSVVFVGFTAETSLPALDLVAKPATIYRGEKSSEWATSGWKLWTTIGGGSVLLLVVIVVVIACVVWKKGECKLPFKKKAKKPKMDFFAYELDQPLPYQFKPLGPDEPRLFADVQWSWPEDEFKHEHAQLLVEILDGKVNEELAIQFLREFPYPMGKHLNAVDVYHHKGEKGHPPCDCGDGRCYLPQSLYWFNEAQYDLIKKKGKRPPPQKADDKEKR